MWVNTRRCVCQIRLTNVHEYSERLQFYVCVVESLNDDW